VALTAEAVRLSASLEDGEVVRRVRAGETELFEVLVRRHDQRVYRTVRSILRDEDEAEDALQQVWIQAYQHLGEFEGAAAFSTWLVRIAANEALQRLRRRRTRLVAVPDDAAAEEAREDVMDRRSEDPEERAAAREAARLLERAVDRLPEHYRTVYVLREVEELSTADTAAALGIGEDATKVRLHRARLILREQLSDLVDRAAPEAFQFLAPRCNRVVENVMAAIARLPPPAAT
jgi:RNA polymerase sigma-70 factor (ECF subfamily)